MERKKYHAGFTVVETVVVLTVLTILVAIGVPAYISYAEKAETRSCLLDLSGIREAYTGEAAFLSYRVEDPLPLLTDAVTRYRGTNVSKTSFTARCGHNCTVVYSDDLTQILLIECSEHGVSATNGVDPSGGSVKLGLSTSGIQALMTDPDIMGVISDYLNDPRYINSRQKGSLDSTGPNFAPSMNAVLKTLGFDIDNSSWRIYYNRTTTPKVFEVYWTDTQVADLKKGDWVRYVKKVYNLDTGTEIGTGETGELPLTTKRVGSSTIIILNSGSESSRRVDESYGDSWQD